MVRLVFRPYTHVRRTICTSVSLRASIRVSPDFTLHKHSSPSFGSQHICSCAAKCNSTSSAWSAQKVLHKSTSLRIWVCHPYTRTHVRLLGPCFKTGRIEKIHRKNARNRCQGEQPEGILPVIPNPTATLKELALIGPQFPNSLALNDFTYF